MDAPESSVCATIEQCISKLAKDESPAVYESTLAVLADDVAIAKTVTETVMRDHTRRHRGTAERMQFIELQDSIQADNNT